LVQDPLWQAPHATPERAGTAAQNAALLGYRKDTLAVLAAMLAVVTLAQMLRGYREKRVGTIGLTYPDRVIRVPQGVSLLEVSLRNGVPHAPIAANVEKLNGALSYGLIEPIRLGIGVHAGLAIAGDIGCHAQFTAIGDPVNVASRLQGLTKSLGCEVLMSEEVYVQAGFAPDGMAAHEVVVGGRNAFVKARIAARAADLAIFAAAQATAAL
jgi:class 3 adenylate cyclase